jgi:hypothetical protein
VAVFRIIPAGDLALNEDGDLVILEDIAYLRQKLAVRFKFFLGEWFLDLRQGIPYYRDIFVKNPNLDVIRSLFRRVILGTPGVLSLPRFELQYDEAARRAHFDFQAVCRGGMIEVSPDDEDFIVDLNESA